MQGENMAVLKDELQEHSTTGSANSANGSFALYKGKNMPEKRGLRQRPRNSERFPQITEKPGLRRLECEYRKLLSGYIRRTPLLLKDLEFQLLAASGGLPAGGLPADREENPLEPYAVTAHGIKFASDGILALGTGKKAGELEKAALRGDLDFLRKKTPEFLSYMDYFMKSLKGLLEGYTFR
jgi:hypothetical protein